MADKRIDELEEALTITSNDLFVLEQASTAKKLTGQTMTTFLTALADGHGGIRTIEKTSSSGVNPVVDTYTITFADDSEETFQVTNGIQGERGLTGPQGPKGDDITVVSQSVQYQAWSSGTVYPTGNWSDNVPAVSQGEYLWTRTMVTYSDDTQTVAYSVARMGVDGLGAVSTVNNIAPDGSGNVQLTAADVGALPTSYQAPVTSVNGMNGDVVIPAAVASVNGKTGTVVLDAEDVGAVRVYKMTAELSSAGWHRIANIDYSALGSVLDFGIYIPFSAGGTEERGEVHSIRYPTIYGAVAEFCEEFSYSDTTLIDRIRRTYGGTTQGNSTWGFDIHYTGSSARTVNVELFVRGCTNESLIYPAALVAVADSPSGESVFPTAYFGQNARKEPYKSLWSGNWSSGSITVHGLSNYNVFLVRIGRASNHSAYNTGVIASKAGGSLRGSGAYASDNAGGNTTYYISATCSNDTLTWGNAGSSASVALEIQEIIGIA